MFLRWQIAAQPKICRTPNPAKFILMNCLYIIVADRIRICAVVPKLSEVMAIVPEKAICCANPYKTVCIL